MDELQISGKRFISSRRIARDNGYTADYIGQLIRGGKVTGQKVGRAWYVDAVSFDAYSGGEGATTKQTGSGYADFPVEMLKPVIPVQRSSDLLVRQSSHDAGEARPFVQEFPAPQAPAPIVLIEKEKEEEVQHVPLHIIKKEEAPVGLRYYHDTEPSLPEIRSVAEIPERIKVFEEPQRTARASKLPVIALAGAGAAIFIFCAVLSSAVSLNFSITEGNAATVSYSVSW